MNIRELLSSTVLASFGEKSVDLDGQKDSQTQTETEIENKRLKKQTKTITQAKRKRKRKKECLAALNKDTPRIFSSKHGMQPR